jgi:hypothetical protein
VGAHNALDVGDVPRMKIRTPVRWYSLSPALNLGVEDVKVREWRHCGERG